MMGMTFLTHLVLAVGPLDDAVALLVHSHTQKGGIPLLHHSGPWSRLPGRLGYRGHLSHDRSDQSVQKHDSD